MKPAALLLCATLLGGCALNQPAPVAAPAHLFADARFAAPSEPVDTSQLFAASPAMREYLHSRRFRELVREKGHQRGLLEALYQAGDLRLDYDATATRSAAQTFDLKSGNCLSLVIMTAAFARAIGMPYTFQEVRVEETWSREGSLYVANNHVNIVLAPYRQGGLDFVGPEDVMVVDFLQREDAARHKTVAVDEQAIRAMYANNRAAEALVAGKVSDAYWWVRKALDASPGFTMAYNTLGVIYQRHGDNALAEQAFRAVLARQPDSRIALQNLVPVLAAQGKDAEAAATSAVLARLDPEPPFHYFQLGQAAMARKDYRQARDLFAREVQRAPYYHEFHFWHAIASLHLGETDIARKELARALETSTTAGNRSRYAAKLEHMRSLTAEPRRR